MILNNTAGERGRFSIKNSGVYRTLSNIMAELFVKIVNRLFQCVWPICGVGAYRVNTSLVRAVISADVWAQSLNGRAAHSLNANYQGLGTLVSFYLDLVLVYEKQVEDWYGFFSMKHRVKWNVELFPQSGFPKWGRLMGVQFGQNDQKLHENYKINSGGHEEGQANFSCSRGNPHPPPSPWSLRNTTERLFQNLYYVGRELAPLIL